MYKYILEKKVETMKHYIEESNGFDMTNSVQQH